MTDELIRKYASEIKRIVAHNTVGDFTWEGLLFSFLREVDESRTLKYEVQTEEGDTVRVYAGGEAAVETEPVYDVFYTNNSGAKELYAHRVSYEDAQEYVTHLAKRTNPRIVQNVEDEENKTYDIQVRQGDRWVDYYRNIPWTDAIRISEGATVVTNVIEYDPLRATIL